ncbi:terpenoid synthase [Fomes fomentarius]|nr:terpenoid synthase [Fomes fomentarius]
MPHLHTDTHEMHHRAPEPTASLQSGLSTANRPYVDGGIPSTDAVSMHKHVGSSAIPAHPSNVTEEVSLNAIKCILQEFLGNVRYRSQQTPQNPEIRGAVTAEIVSWDRALSWTYINALTDTSCTVAECAYPHTSYEHQLLIALYTAYLTYADDVGQHNVEAVGQFVRRFTQKAPQLDPAFDRLTALLGTMYGFYPYTSGDGIINNTLDSLTGMYIELTTQGGVIAPAAARYPYYLRLKTGIASAYAHFNFTRDWAVGAGMSYLQMLPDLELIIVGVNDILSFYKETLAGETDNYVHMRAVAERKPPIKVLRQLADEVLDSVSRLEELAAAQSGLDRIFRSFLMGYIEFHFNARRYHMEDLDV